MNDKHYKQQMYINNSSQMRWQNPWNTNDIFGYFELSAKMDS